MKSYCFENNVTGGFYRILLEEEELCQFLLERPELTECNDIIESSDAPCITLE